MKSRREAKETPPYRRRTGFFGVLGVRSFLFVMLSACTVVPMSFFGFIQARRWAKSEIAASDRQALAAAQSAASQLSLAMLGYVHAAESFSAQLSARETLDRSTLESVMNAHREFHREFLGAYVADKSGKALLHQSASGEFIVSAFDYSDRQYYKELLRTRQTVISRAIVGRLTHQLSVNIVVPIFDRQHQLSLFTCSPIDLGAIAGQAKQSVIGMNEGRVVIIDSEGQIIADSSRGNGVLEEKRTALPIFAKVLGGPELRIGEDETHRAVRGFAVGLFVPINGWRAVALTPKSAIDANARKAMVQTAGASAVLILAMLGLAAWLSGWISRPLRALASTAKAVTLGDFAAPKILRWVPDEMAQLTSSISAMIDRLNNHARNLELEVEARTQSLSLANRELTAAVATIQHNEQRIREDIAKARLFQEKMLPRVPLRADLDVSVWYSPLEQVSGDIYDVAEIRQDLVRVFVADVIGHGVQASMRTILLKSAYERMKAAQPSPSAVLQSLNEHLVDQFPNGDLHCAACCVDIRVLEAGAELLYANAANGPVFVFTPGGPTREIYDGGPLIGVDATRIHELPALKLDPGQLVLIPTDGLIEQSNQEHVRFESEVLKVVFDTTDTAATLSARVMESFDRFRGSEPVADDITFLVVHLKPQPTSGRVRNAEV